MIFDKKISGFFQSRQKILLLEKENTELKNKIEIFEKRLLEYLAAERKWVENRLETAEDTVLELGKNLESISQHVGMVQNKMLEDIENTKEYCDSLFHEKHEMILENRRCIDGISKHVEIVREQIYVEINNLSCLNGKLFHEKHEMIMKEHEIILELVRCMILEYYKEKEPDIEQRKVLDWLSCNFLRMIPYEFYDQYMKADVLVEHEDGYKFVTYKNTKVFFPKKYSVAQVEAYWKVLMAEQDISSPHRYFDNEYTICPYSIFIDCGAAEGLIGLEYIEQIEKLILIENDPDWIEALERTFAPYGSKVEIIPKFVSNQSTETEITLDDIMVKRGLYTIKMDVEGAEMQVLNGLNVDKLDSGSKIVVCAYHRQDDEKQISDFFERSSIEYKTTNGFLLSDWGGFKEPFLRRGVIRAVYE